MSNFWQQLPKPFFALAPMEDVTDTVFREVVAGMADPNYLQVLYTEFASVDGLNHPVGKKNVAHRLLVSESERTLLKQKNIKLVAQIWGKNPELFHKIAREITEEFEFDGIDVNMGCPVKKVVKNGCCSALIDQPEQAKEIILATKEATYLPVSVKTRTGIRIHETERWMTSIMETRPAAVVLHGRTQKQQSDGLASWEEIGKGVAIRNRLSPETIFLGNGDVNSVAQGVELTEKYGLDGIMVGRGIFHNPWIFQPNHPIPQKEEKLSRLLFHTQLFEKIWGSGKSINILKRFYKIYTNDFTDAAKLRVHLMDARSYEEIYLILQNELKNQ
ncbi:MAG: tRNA-dihydrouridine synthase [Prolixibacteraceae bacterium]|jgi:tRNA-dihydrouridine synthase|nr:tRNA-dihydrouridine synthase [Prolixibacteraceae bacterium]